MLVDGSRNTLTWNREERKIIENQVYNDFFPPRGSNPEAVLRFHIRWIYTVLIKRPLSHPYMLWM